MSTFGKTVRLNRLKNPISGRILTVAIDHAPSYGVLDKLENIEQIVHNVAKGKPDAIMLMKGTADRCFPPFAGHIPLILKSSTLSVFHPERDVWVNHVDDAVRMGADAIAMAVTVGSRHQAKLISAMSALVREAEGVGMPVIVHAYPNGELVPEEERFTAKQVGYASRLAMELGVDIIKTFYTGSADSFAEVVEVASPALVVAAGGPRLDTDEEVFRMAAEVVESRAAGITFGRNIWQSSDPQSMIEQLKRIVHEAK
jgi:class I fructose-bisphosphate aldolase